MPRFASAPLAMLGQTPPLTSIPPSVAERAVAYDPAISGTTWAAADSLGLGSPEMRGSYGANPER